MNHQNQGLRDKKKFRRNMRISLGIFIGLFTVLIVYLGYSVIVYGERWFATPYNPRIQHSTAIAGDIMDSSGIRLAWTEDKKRHYHPEKDVRRAISHVVGDSGGFSMGAETIFAKQLCGVDKDIFSRINDAVSGGSSIGSNITLTIDSALSEYIYDNMNARDGSVVILNYRTGEIIASVSIPTFDPEELLSGEPPEESSLVDRATMGKYPPGSTMKIVTASAALKANIDISYTCKALEVIEGQRITCVKKHGKNDLKGAFAKSCNTYFAMLSLELGGDKLSEAAQDFGFNTDFNFSDINLYASSFENSLNKGDIAWAGIGQYKDLITPMHTAMISGAVANGGVMMEPRLLKKVGNESETQPKEYAQVMDSGAADKLKEYMLEVVNSGTGTSAKLGIKGVSMYGKTGTAEFTEDGKIKNHSWFTGFVDDESHPYAIAVIYEGAGFGSKQAAPSAAKFMKKALEG